ncbi:MAG: hypothetical protein GY732_01460, partial [Gammaproteobacteria bacterium]|nr:hypothetical protein [Gammaproteobacteria bacterium]
ASVGTVGLRNYATFKNLGGEIKIDSSSQGGILCYAGTFTNSATITIGANSSVGDDGIYNLATFNNLGGEINIDRSTSNGILNESGVFTNQANITIGAIASVGSHGIYIYDTFENSNGGQISIANSTVWAIRSRGSISNLDCSIVRLFGGLKNQYGTVLNEGLFSIDASTASVPGNFTNNGVIEDVQGSFPTPGGGYVNNEIIIAPTSIECGNASPAFQLGNPLDFTIHGVFTDANATISAGTYDVNTNT